MIFLIAAIAFFASTIGAICGIGGGVIIKPVMDAFGVMDVSVINFLSGCTVLSMTCCGILGGFAGRKVNSRIDDRAVDKLFIGLMVVIMGICVFNMIKYMGV